MPRGYSSSARLACLGLLHHRFRRRRFAAGTRHQLDASSKQSGQIVLPATPGEKADPGHRPKFHQQIHIALRPEVCAACRTMQLLCGNSTEEWVQKHRLHPQDLTPGLQVLSVRGMRERLRPRGEENVTEANSCRFVGGTQVIGRQPAGAAWRTSRPTRFR